MLSNYFLDKVEVDNALERGRKRSVKIQNDSLGNLFKKRAYLKSQFDSVAFTARKTYQNFEIEEFSERKNDKTEEHPVVKRMILYVLELTQCLNDLQSNLSADDAVRKMVEEMNEAFLPAYYVYITNGLGTTDPKVIDELFEKSHAIPFLPKQLKYAA
jgi:hypothetical protein